MAGLPFTPQENTVIQTCVGEPGEAYGRHLHHTIAILPLPSGTSAQPCFNVNAQLLDAFILSDTSMHPLCLTLRLLPLQSLHTAWHLTAGKAEEFLFVRSCSGVTRMLASRSCLVRGIYYEILSRLD